MKTTFAEELLKIRHSHTTIFPSTQNVRNFADDLIENVDGAMKSGMNVIHFKSFLQSLGLEDKKSLVVLGGLNNNVYLSSRNLKGAEVVMNSELSTYKIMNANSLVLFEGSLEGIEANLSK